ncbi:peptide deformylase [Sulfitobacter pacificus]|uniref:Peptide deformylase-like n=1 Tax=Sulfitobacter pacificus TaxID=1499314 RepID=A0ABQ5VCT1_9RHOB|nr:peptide deformylase [Sulfitobacter pacificus]GLQ25321.1 peptide deformylase [Sulfitobacter pacificus]
MTVRKILQWPDKRLRTKAEEVSEITDEIRTIWQDMVDTMDAMPGVGLGAPQIGVMLQLAVVDASSDRNKRILMANPQVIESSAKPNVHEEASPCLPGVSAKITRPRAVSVRYLNADGVIARGEFVGLEATSVQHQIDHLAGRMYFDKLSKTKRDMLLRKAQKLKG